MTMLRWVKTALVGSFFCSSMLFGNSVIQVLENGKKLEVALPDGKWNSGQVVCVMRNSMRVACGLIASMSEGKAVISLDFRNSMPAPGDLVVSATDARKMERASTRRPASEELSKEVPLGDHVRFSARGRQLWQISAVGFWDVDQISAGFAIERFMGPRVTYGVQVTGYDIGENYDSLGGYTVGLQRTFRATRKFSGVFATLGAGAYIFKIGKTNPFTSVSATVYWNAGWALRVTHWLTFNAAVGVTYITLPKRDGVDIGRFQNLRPNFLASIGFAL